MAEPSHPLYSYSPGQRTRWLNVKNVSGQHGMAGRDCRYPRVDPGDRLVLAQLSGSSVIDHIWMTFNWPGSTAFENAVLCNRAVRIEMFWDDAERAAVAAPIGDFFGHLLGIDTPFENSLFSNPAGRTFQCSLPMPFRRSARIEIINEFDRPLTVFFDIRYRANVSLSDTDYYFHATWQRSAPLSLDQVHSVVPTLPGKGRYLGTHIGIVSNPNIPLEWHNGHLKFYVDDNETPSMMTASLDDYCGSCWHVDRVYHHRDSGLLFSQFAANHGGHHGLYCYHRRDPLYFSQSCRVELTPGGGASTSTLHKRFTNTPKLIEHLSPPMSLRALAENSRSGNEEWLVCQRRDDISTVALYYWESANGVVPRHTASATTSAWHWPHAIELHSIDSLADSEIQFMRGNQARSAPTRSIHSPW